MALVAEASGLMEPLKELIKVKKIPVWVNNKIKIKKKR